jgi:exosortase
LRARMNDQATVGVLDQFQTELVASWRRVPNKGFLFILLAAWLGLFHLVGNSTFGYVASPSLFRWLWNACTGRDADGQISDDSLSLWVPLLVLGLLWWKRKELVEVRFQLWWPGLLIVALGIVFHLVGFVIQKPRISILGMVIGIYGLTGLTWGPEWLRRSFFPFFLMVFCVPFSGPLDFITVRLRLLSSRIVEDIAHYGLGIGVVRDGAILKDPNNAFQYEVAAACSGIRSLVSIGLMATIGAFLSLRSWWRRLVVISLAAPLSVVGNVLRLLTIIVSAEMGGQQAGNYVHEGGPGGVISLLPYVPAFFGLIYAVQVFKRQEEKEALAP